MLVPRDPSVIFEADLRLVTGSGDAVRKIQTWTSGRIGIEGTTLLDQGHCAPAWPEAFVAAFGYSGISSWLRCDSDDPAALAFRDERTQGNSCRRDWHPAIF